MLVLKVDNFEKFTVGGNAFQTSITRSTKKLLPVRLGVDPGLNNLYWWPCGRSASRRDRRRAAVCSSDPRALSVLASWGSQSDPHRRDWCRSTASVYSQHDDRLHRLDKPAALIVDHRGFPADQNLFDKILQDSSHLLQPPTPPFCDTPNSYSVRPRAHDRALPEWLTRWTDCNH